MLTITLSIPKDTATPALRRLRVALEPENLLPRLGASVANTVRSHFDDLESSRPNKLGGARQHYYAGASRGTSFVVDGDTALIGVRQVGMRLRYYGGTVNAGVNTSSFTGRPTKYLTIPVTAEAYGHRASDFPDLQVLWGAAGPYGLGRVTKGTLARAGSTTQVEMLFALKASVDVPADETMLPDNDTLQANTKRDFYRYVGTIWRRVSGENFGGGS